MVARAAGSVGDEARALIVVSILELRFGDVATARERCCATPTGRPRPPASQARRSWSPGPPRPGRAFELDLGNLAAACAALDQATDLAEHRPDLERVRDRQPGAALHRPLRGRELGRGRARGRRRAPAGGVRVALYVEVGRGRQAATARLARLAPYRAADPYVAYLAGGSEADLVRWQGDPARSSELARDTLATQEEAGAPWVLSAIWPAALALAAEGDLAERARAAGDLAAAKEHLAVGEDVLERARAPCSEPETRDVRSARRRWPGWPGPRPSRPGSRAAPTRDAGAAAPTPSATATCTRRPRPLAPGRGAPAGGPPRRGGHPGQGGPRAGRAAGGGAAPGRAGGPRPAAPRPRRRACPRPRRPRPHPPRAGGAAPGGWPPAAPTARSPRPCSSAARRPASTSATSWPSWACTPGPRRRPRLTVSVWTTPPARWP